MLVLSRQRDETIMIGDDIEITIVDIRGDKVRLGITAPATIPVHRKEVYEAIQRENRAASQVKMEDMQSLPKAPGGGGVVKPGSVPPGLHRPKPPLPPAARPGPADPKDPPHAGASNGTLTPSAPPAPPSMPPGNANGTLPSP